MDIFAGSYTFRKYRKKSSASLQYREDILPGHPIFMPKNHQNRNPFLKNIPLKDHKILTATAKNPVQDENPSADMQLVFKDEIPAADVPRAHQTQPVSMADQPAEEPAMQDEAEGLKRRAAERINKLRNLSFNMNAADPNNEFETVPAYIRRNLELYNT